LKLTKDIYLSSIEETFAFGRDILGKNAQQTIFFVYSTLGVGKTA